MPAMDASSSSRIVGTLPLVGSGYLSDRVSNEAVDRQEILVG